MKKGMKLVCMVLTLAMLLGLLAGCGGKGGDDSNGGGSDQTLLLGLIGPMTGDYAHYGTSTRDGAQVAVEEINAAGGVNGWQLKLQTEDSQGDPDSAISAFGKLMDDEMDVSLGCVLSGEAQSVITAAKNDNVLVVTCTSSAEKCIQGNDKAFRVCFNDPAQGTASADYIADNKLGSKIAVFYQSDIDYSAGLVETFTAQVMADLEQGSYSVLLLDLRNNGGGSDGVIIPLLMELAPLVRSGELELWGLVGEATFSSASINALEIREMGGGLAGEPTSGSVDHFGSTGSFTLPNTGVRVSMSTKFIDTGTLLECAAGLGVEPIQPDVTVYQTLEDYLAGQDTLVDALCARTEPFQPQERPDAPLSRGRLTELLRQAAEQAGLDTQAPMQSLSDLLPCAWYAPGVCWALSSGVASGTGEAMFQASRPVTRQEGAAMVWQTARLLGMAPSGTAELTDAGSIASWALDAAQWAVSAGGLDTQNGAFHPQDTLTRAEGEALLSLLP